MLLSIYTTVTDPEQRQYPWKEAIKSYLALADEVVIIDGSDDDDVKKWIDDNWVAEKIDINRVRVIKMPWPVDYTQREFPEHLNAGLLACRGDWVMKCDVDTIVHEKSIVNIRHRLAAWRNVRPYASYNKFTVIDRKTGILKSKVPFIINRVIAPTIRFGIDVDGKYNDWSWPVYPTSVNEMGVPVGKPLNQDDNFIGEMLWNYDYYFRTKDVARFMLWRAARAYMVDTGVALWGHDEDSAWRAFASQMMGRLQKGGAPITPTDHPVYVRDRANNIKPDQFGYDHWQGDFS